MEGANVDYQRPGDVKQVELVKEDWLDIKVGSGLFHSSNSSLNIIINLFIYKFLSK